MTDHTIKPLCFIIMPFGVKPDSNGRDINFDDIYTKLIKPAILAADLQPLRADEDAFSGIIHKAMYERLMLCDFAIADVSNGNPNVFYELGIRHGIRPHTTLPIYAEGHQIPFDLNSVRTLPYRLNSGGEFTHLKDDLQKLTTVLKACQNPVEDSPLFQLVTNWPRPDIARLKTDVFRDLVEYSSDLKMELQTARKSGKDAVHRIAQKLDILTTEPGIAIDVLLSFRAVEDWAAMVETVKKMPRYISRSVLVQEQYAFALNRLQRSEEAETVCLEIISKQGSSSETNGILGRIYKDRWRSLLDQGKKLLATGALKKAIASYLEGYNADIRDTYPGINAATLMSFVPEMRAKQLLLIGALEYALQLRLASKNADYWDHATQFELQVLKKDFQKSAESLIEMSGMVREPWEPKTTLRNLEFIAEACASNSEDEEALNEVLTMLRQIVKEQG